MTRSLSALRRRRGLFGAAALLLLGLFATAASAASRSPPPAMLDEPMRLTQGTKAPAEASGNAAPPPTTLPPGANLGMAQANTGTAALNFPSAPMSFPAGQVTAAQSPAVAPQGSAAVPGTAPATGVPPGGARFGLDSAGAQDRKGHAEADAGPPAALPLGARLGTAQMTFSAAEMRFADAHLAAASTHFAAPSAAAALPGGMALREEGRGLRVTLDADVLFDFDRAELRRDAGPRLQRLMEEVSTRIPRPAFRVEGHTDWIGTDAYNLRLSTRRAESVRDWLVRQGGVPRPAVATVGYGESRPVAPNNTPDGRDDPDGRQRNRRVELLVTPR